MQVIMVGMAVTNPNGNKRTKGAGEADHKTGTNSIKNTNAAKSRWINILIVFFVLVAIVSGGRLAIYAVQEGRDKKELSELSDLFHGGVGQDAIGAVGDGSDLITDGAGGANGAGAGTGSMAGTLTGGEQNADGADATDDQGEAGGIAGEAGQMLPAFAELYKQNSDIVGWITIGGTSVDYPVMQTKENPEFYLRRNFEKEYSNNGLPFVDARCEVEPASDIIYLYGHNMRSKIMFSDLELYESQEFLEENPVISFTALNGARRYQITDVLRINLSDSGNPARIYDFVDLSEEGRLEEFEAAKEEMALYRTGDSGEPGDRWILLSTCSYHDTEGRLILVGKLLQ